ncbi:MAG: GH25 family lysozyme [Eubacteriales bacterium]
MFTGIDVSHNNGVIDWRKVKESGIDFAMIRAGGGNYVDRQFKANMANALRYGIDCGSYWFSYAVNRAEAVAEAKMFLSLVKPYKLTYPLAFDYEYASVDHALKDHGITITPEIACDIVAGFMNFIAAAGYYIVNYTNNDYLSRYFTHPCMSKYEVWLARWTKFKPPNVTGLWQNEVRGSVADVQAYPQRATVVGGVPGIKGAIDMDISYKDYPSIIRSAKLNNIADKPVAVPKKPETVFLEGELVRVKKPIIYGTTKRFVVLFRDYEVIGKQKNDRVVIGKKGRVTAAIAAENLEKLIQ